MRIIPARAGNGIKVPSRLIVSAGSSPPAGNGSSQPPGRVDPRIIPARAGNGGFDRVVDRPFNGSSLGTVLLPDDEVRLERIIHALSVRPELIMPARAGNGRLSVIAARSSRMISVSVGKGLDEEAVDTADGDVDAGAVLVHQGKGAVMDVEATLFLEGQGTAFPQLERTQGRELIQGSQRSMDSMDSVVREHAFRPPPGGSGTSRSRTPWRRRGPDAACGEKRRRR